MRFKLHVPNWTREQGIERFQRHLVAAYTEFYGVAPRPDQIEATIRVSGLFLFIEQPQQVEEAE